MQLLPCKTGSFPNTEKVSYPIDAPGWASDTDVYNPSLPRYGIILEKHDPHGSPQKIQEDQVLNGTLS